MSDSSLVNRLQERIADREPVDWDAIASDGESTFTLSDDDRKDLALLRLLDEVADAHTSFQSASPVGDADAAQEPVLDPIADDDTLAAWGRYRLDQKVGRGGFGSVYRAWDPVLEMPVAIKILHRRLSDERLQERLLREGRALAQVKHPNVVRVLNVERHADRLGLVMEFLRGETIEAMVAAQGRMNEREATVIAEDVCRALAAVHSNRLVHRDVKARNVIRERDGRIVLMDFGAGLSETAGSDEAAIVGTPLYMAPEVLSGEQAIVASDVYGVGVLLFFLVTGRHPFEGATIDDIRRAQADGRRPALMALRPDLPASFIAVVERALALSPRERLATPAALVQLLAAARATGTDWRRTALRAMVAATALMALLTLAGMLTSGAFNLTLGRGEYATESFADWFALGRRSLVMPLVLSLLCVGAIGLLVAMRSVVVTASARMRTIDRRVATRCRSLADSLSLREPVVGSSWLVLVTTAFALAVGMYWAPLLRAVTSNASTASADTLSILSPPFTEYRTVYRMALSLLAVANAAGWYVVSRGATRRGLRLPWWLKPTEISILVLLIGLMQVPYRLIHDSDEFAILTWQGQRCFVLGERPGNLLLFCPGLSPRNIVIPESTPRAEPTNSGESLFTSFTPAGS